MPHRRAAAFLMFVFSIRIQAVDLARLYIYSPRYSDRRSCKIVLGDDVVGELSRGQLLAIDLAPGKYTISAEGGATVPVELSAGSTVYYRTAVQYSAGSRPVPVLSFVPELIAERESRYLSYVDAKHIRSSLVAHADPRQPHEHKLLTREPR